MGGQNPTLTLDITLLSLLCSRRFPPRALPPSGLFVARLAFPQQRQHSLTPPTLLSKETPLSAAHTPCALKNKLQYPPAPTLVRFFSGRNAFCYGAHLCRTESPERVSLNVVNRNRAPLREPQPTSTQSQRKKQSSHPNLLLAVQCKFQPLVLSGCHY